MPIALEPLKDDDRERFIRDNQEAFRYGATEEFGLRDDHFEEPGEIISRETIEKSIDGGTAYRIVKDGRPVGGAIVSVTGDRGDLQILFVSPEEHSKRVRGVVRHRAEVPPGEGVGDLHPVFREAEHTLLREQMRLPHHGVLPQPQSRPEQPRRRGRDVPFREGHVPIASISVKWSRKHPCPYP